MWIIKKNKAIPTFLGYCGYPNSICASINEVVIHGIPSKKHILKNGDIISDLYGHITYINYLDTYIGYTVDDECVLLNNKLEPVKKFKEIGIIFPSSYDNYILPKNGVYLTKVKVKDKEYIAMTNIGYNPTINEQEKPRLEVHILDFNDEIYGEILEVSFIKYLREEKRFSSKEELINSLEETLNICREYKDMLK